MLCAPLSTTNPTEEDNINNTVHAHEGAYTPSPSPSQRPRPPVSSQKQAGVFGMQTAGSRLVQYLYLDEITKSPPRKTKPHPLPMSSPAHQDADDHRTPELRHEVEQRKRPVSHDARQRRKPLGKERLHRVRQGGGAQDVPSAGQASQARRKKARGRAGGGEG